MKMFSMCICVCLDNDDNVFRVYLCVCLTAMTMFSMCICVCLDNDENVFHVYLCLSRQR